MAHPLRFKSYLEILRGNAAAALSAAEALEAVSQQHGMTLWRTLAESYVILARSRLHAPATGAELRRALAAAEVGGTLSFWFINALLAEFELETLGPESALASVDEALALGHQVENRCDHPFLYRLRGEILLKHDPNNPAPAEEAFQTALAIARQQGARSWGLRSALSLAKLYQSTDRPAEAHAVLALALEGFSPTPVMPEIAEARALMERLA
jgi:hypothetical protein